MLAFDGALRLESDVRFGLSRDDWYATPQIAWRAAPAFTLGLGAIVFGGVDGGLGALYDHADHVWLRASLDLE